MNIHITKAALLLIASLWVLSILDASGKWLQQAGVALAMIVWARYLVHALLLSAYLGLRAEPFSLATSSPKVQILRGFLIVICTGLFFKSLSVMPLAQATAINFTAPLITTCLAPWLLGEKTQANRWIAILVALIGVLIVIRPSASLPPEGVVWSLATALSFSLYQIATRFVAKDDPLLTNFLSGWVGTAVTSLSMIWFWKTPQVDRFTWLILASTGLTGLIGHLLQVNAFRLAPANVLAPFTYFQIIAATGVGWLVFKQMPDALTYLGIGIIVASGLSVAVIERQRARRLVLDQQQL